MSVLQQYRDKGKEMSPQKMNKVEMLNEIQEWDKERLIHEIAREMEVSTSGLSEKRMLRHIFVKACKLKCNNNMYRKALDERELIVENENGLVKKSNRNYKDLKN